jgi:hypothetical protein
VTCLLVTQKVGHVWGLTWAYFVELTLSVSPLIHKWFCACIIRRLLIFCKVPIDAYLNLMLQRELVMLTLQITRLQWCECNIEINLCLHIKRPICNLIHLGTWFYLPWNFLCFWSSSKNFLSRFVLIPRGTIPFMSFFFQNQLNKLFFSFKFLHCAQSINNKILFLFLNILLSISLLN